MVLMNIFYPRRAAACLAKIYRCYSKRCLSRRTPALLHEYYRRLARTGIWWHVVGICSAFLSVYGFCIWIQANMFKVRACYNVQLSIDWLLIVQTIWSSDLQQNDLQYYHTCTAALYVILHRLPLNCTQFGILPASVISTLTNTYHATYYNTYNFVGLLLWTVMFPLAIVAVRFAFWNTATLCLQMPHGLCSREKTQTTVGSPIHVTILSSTTSSRADSAHHYLHGNIIGCRNQCVKSRISHPIARLIFKCNTCRLKIDNITHYIPLRRYPGVELRPEISAFKAYTLTRRCRHCSMHSAPSWPSTSVLTIL